MKKGLFVMASLLAATVGSSVLADDYSKSQSTRSREDTSMSSKMDSPMTKKGMTSKEWSSEQRNNLADIHSKMAECLRSDKSVTECRSEMKDKCRSMGKDACPMMMEGRA